MSEQSAPRRKYKALGDELLRAIGDKRQSEIAHHLYVTQPAVANWLSGKCRPDPGNLGQIIAVLQRPYAYLEYVADLAGYAGDHDPNAWDKVLHAYTDKLRLLGGKGLQL